MLIGVVDPANKKAAQYPVKGTPISLTPIDTISIQPMIVPRAKGGVPDMATDCAYSWSKWTDRGKRDGDVREIDETERRDRETTEK